MKALANEIYDNLLDMDFMDYNEASETEMASLMADLELLEKMGNGALLNAIQMLMENN